jgi:hypothetical protein
MWRLRIACLWHAPSRKFRHLATWRFALHSRMQHVEIVRGAHLVEYETAVVPQPPLPGRPRHTLIGPIEHWRERHSRPPRREGHTYIHLVACCITLHGCVLAVSAQKMHEGLARQAIACGEGNISVRSASVTAQAPPPATCFANVLGGCVERCCNSERQECRKAMRHVHVIVQSATWHRGGRLASETARTTDTDRPEPDAWDAWDACGSLWGLLKNDVV